MYRNLFFAVLFIHHIILFGQDVSIMTYNIRLDVASDSINAWGNRKDYFIDQLKFYEPDIIGFQEVTPSQLTYLAAALDKYHYVGKGRELNNQGESSNIFFKKDKFKLKDSGTFWLSETPEEVSKGWDAACNRVCTYALVHDSKVDKTFYVFNTHLDHIGELARVKSLELILSKIHTINKGKYPVFFMGDFNCTPNSEGIKSLNSMMHNTRNISTLPSFGPIGTFNGFKHNEPVTHEIDYIFISKESTFTILKHAVLSDSKDLRYPSDHLPVLIYIRY